MGYFGRPNKALANLEFKRPIWSQIGVEPDGRKREEERRKRKKRRGRRRAKPKRYGTLDFVWKLTLIMNPMRFGMDLWFCRIIIFPKLGVLLGFHLNPKIIVSKVGKTPHGTRWL